MQRILLAPLLVALVPATARAQGVQVELTHDISEFIGRSCAVAQGDYPAVGITTAPIQVGELTLTQGGPALELFVDEWTPNLEGLDLAISGLDSFDVWVGEPMTAFGFEMIEPSVPGPAPGCNFPVCLDSSFELSLYLGGQLLETIGFEVPADEVAFVGLLSNTEFDRVELREQTDDIGNEYFGELFVGRCPATVGYGEATPGSGGFVPTLQTPPIAPKLGTTTSLSGTGLLGGAPVLLAVGFEPQELPIQGIQYLVQETLFLPLAASGEAGEAGAGAFEQPLFIPGGDQFIGTTVYLQAIVFDDGGPAFGLAASEGLALTFCAAD